ncbi:hypothetical protein [Streptomyces lancefieldiae]|uniref:Uncharacterized protein n=1 Tax=Streptomyces lancefieldiae TaxID=3075520 RepID=A0ABU3B0Z5_9ACTN|nr:hypothetical protein [Streptomyces sp. DSM 40712]MDT0616120.1 hypothetical protein [Streptomyces sp. DSM 40712]
MLSLAGRLSEVLTASPGTARIDIHIGNPTFASGHATVTIKLP